MITRFSRSGLRILVRAGLIQVIFLSRKGRLTQFTERLEPFIRRKFVRRKWFPPLLVAVNPVDAPNEALEAFFARNVFFLRYKDQRSIIRWLIQCIEKSPEGPVSILKKVKRPGSPWEMSPSLRRRDDWTNETRALLEKMSIPPNAPVVLLAVRDAAYYEALRKTRGADVGPAASTDTYVRNPQLSSYSLAVSRLSELGCVVVRVGSEMSNLPSELHGMVVDYAASHRTPRGDLLLGRHCTMIMSGAAGAWILASLFNRPVAMSNNYIPFVGGVSARDRQIPQLLWSRREQRFLNFREMVLTEDKYSYASTCNADEINLIKNTPEELADHAVEVLMRLRGDFLETPRDKALLRRFTDIQKLSPPPVHMRSPIALTFLRRHENLLE